MKKVMFGIIVVLISIIFSIPIAYSHPGRTDSSGGHHDNFDGGYYHYHNDGMPSHSYSGDHYRNDGRSSHSYSGGQQHFDENETGYNNHPYRSDFHQNGEWPPNKSKNDMETGNRIEVHDRDVIDFLKTRADRIGLTQVLRFITNPITKPVTNMYNAIDSTLQKKYNRSLDLILELSVAYAFIDIFAIWFYHKFFDNIFKDLFNFLQFVILCLPATNGILFCTRMVIVGRDDKEMPTELFIAFIGLIFCGLMVLSMKNFVVGRRIVQNNIAALRDKATKYTNSKY